ncbi:hypothetical protein [uncultured Cytophaga sp.]|uniref:hypothetical protein n=1 Tax=uncultured Cytophaga sp. TaxID=160238 RepID=UPI002620576B|nr:hypothetical protein [uncultured Cytophaga sp.]
MLKIAEDLKEKISYFLIAGILIVAVLPLIVEMPMMVLFVIRTILVGGLASLYLLTAETKDLVFVAFATFILLCLVQLILPNLEEQVVKMLFILAFVTSALAMGVLAYKHSKEFKSFEILEFLLVVFLLISASQYIIQTEYSLYYPFAVCFIIATLMYNNNLWMRYKDSEKELLIFLLTISFVDVIQVSAKFIRF